MRLDYPEPTGDEALDGWLEDLVGMLRYPDLIEAETLRIFGPVNLENFSSGYMGGWEVSEDALSSTTSSGRFGNLNGFLDYTANTFGIGIGNTGANMANFSYDSTNGLRLRTDTTEIIVLDNSGNAYISGTLTIGSGGIPASTVNGWAHASDLTKIDGGDIYTNTVTATQIAANTITAAEIFAGTITTTEIATDTIVAGNIAANAVDTSEIAANAVTTDQIAANTIVAGDIFAGTITTTEIASTTILAGNIAAGTITANEIFGNTITANEIAVGTITATEITGSTLSAIYADVGALTAGTLSSSDYAAAVGMRLDLDNKWLKMGGSNVTAAGAAAGVFLGLDTSYKFYVGNAANEFIKFDGSNLTYSTAQSNGITIKSGGDINIEDGGDLIFSGSTYSTTLDYTEVGTALKLEPSVAGTVNATWGVGSAFKTFQVRTTDKVDFQANEDGDNAVWLTLDTTHAYADALFTLTDEGTTKYLQLYYENGGNYYLGPTDDGNMNLGDGTNHWNLVFCNAVGNVDSGPISVTAYEDANNDATILVSRTTESVIAFALKDEGTSKTVACVYENGGNYYFGPDTDGECDLGTVANKFNDVHTDNINGAAPCRIKTGTYTGNDSTDQGITGVGFQPLMVIVSSVSTNATQFMKWEGMTSDYSIFLANGTMLQNRLISLDADGFSVDDSGSNFHPNTNAHNYTYIAVG